MILKKFKKTAREPLGRRGAHHSCCLQQAGLQRFCPRWGGGPPWQSGGHV